MVARRADDWYETTRLATLAAGEVHDVVLVADNPYADFDNACSSRSSALIAFANSRWPTAKPRGTRETAQRLRSGSDPALGYTLVGSVTPGHAASLSDDELLGLLAGRGADFVVITAGNDEAKSEHAALDSLRRLGSRSHWCRACAACR